MIELCGGWGYQNLGDEAILAGYAHRLGRGRNVRIWTPSRRRTARSQPGRPMLRSEFRGRSARGPVVLAGGGYLNGNWTIEIGHKLDRLNRIAREGAVVVHGVELRALAGSDHARAASRLLASASIAVRDTASADEAERLGLQRPVVLPDGITFLRDSLRSLLKAPGIATGRVLLNLLDISDRPDAGEAEVDLSRWTSFCRQLIDVLGPRALGLVVGAGDREYMSTFPGFEIVEPETVVGLASLLAEADAVLSVRMHPALVGSMVSTPTVSIPYCGKVRPTLTRIGIENHLATTLDLAQMMERFEATEVSDEAWARAAKENDEWLTSHLPDHDPVFGR